MKLVQTTIIAGLSFFLSTGISFAADMDDIELTIRVVETENIEEMHNELSLPDAASDTAREHAEKEDGRGLTQANAVREAEHENEAEHVAEENEMRDEEHEELEDESREDERDRDDEHHDADEVEDHEKEHEDEDDQNAPGSTN